MVRIQGKLRRKQLDKEARLLYGSRGMGQAQSQSDPFSCADCYGYGGSGIPGSQTSTSPFAPGLNGEQLSGGRRFDASGRPILTTGADPGLSQTDIYGRPIGGDGRSPGVTGPTQAGQGFIPGRGPGAGQQHGGQVPGQLLETPVGSLIQSGTRGQNGKPGVSGTNALFIPGQTPGTHQTRPGQTGGYQQGGQVQPGTGGGTIFTPGQAGQAPGSFQTHPGQTILRGPDGGQAPGTHQIQPGQAGGDLLPGTTTGGGRGPSGSFQTYPGGPGSGTILRPGQTHPSQTGGLQPGITGGPGTGTYFTPGQVSTGGQYPSGGSQPGSDQTPSTHAGGTQGTTGGPATGTQFTPGQAPGLLQIRPGQVGGPSGGQIPGSIHTQPGSQIYDHDGLQKPGGRPVHPGDVGAIAPGAQIQQGGVTTQPGETTYFIPGGIRQRPGDGSFGYYPSTGTPGGRIQGGDSGIQDGTFNGQLAGQYRPASGPGGEFSGTFQGRYSPHGSRTHIGSQGAQISGGGQQTGDSAQQVHYPGSIIGSGGQRGQGSLEQQGFPGESVGGQQWSQAGTPGSQIPTGSSITGQIPGQYVQGIGTQGGTSTHTGQGTFIPGQTQIPSTSQTIQNGYPDTTSSGHVWSGQPGQSQLSPGGSQPGYQHGTVHTPGQIHTTTGGQYPSGGRQPGYQQGTVHTPGQIHTTTAGQYPSSAGGQPGYQQGTSGQGPIGGQPGYQQGAGQIPEQSHLTTDGQYPSGSSGQPGYQQGAPGQLQISTGGQYPTGGTSQPGYQQGTPGQIHSGTDGQYPGSASGQPGYQTGTGQPQGHLQTPTGALYPGGSGQPGYHQGTEFTPGYPGQTTGTGQQGGTTGGQQFYGQQPGTSGQQIGGGGPTYGTQTPYGQQGGQTLGSGVGDYAGSGVPQVGQFQLPGQAGQGLEADDSDTQAQSTIQRSDNETQASASSSGRFAGGTAQSQVSGSYAGTGSFSASAGSNDGLRGAQTQVSGNSEGTLSSSQGMGGRGKSQAQVQLSADTGDTTSSAQSGGLNHGTNTQVQSGIKGGMADAQANGPGSTSSQAQIGFSPYDANTNDDDPGNPHNGGGTASASSGTHAGKSQVQINGKYAFGIRYTGQAQASSANSGYTADNINLPTMRPIDFSQNTYSKPAKQEKVNVRQIDDPSLIKIITSSTTPLPDDDDEEEYDDYEDPNPPPRHNLVQQAKTRSLMHDALDPLEDIEDHGIQIEGQLKHGDIIQTGQYIPGSTGYKIPQGFRGRVTEDQQQHETDSDLGKRIIYAAGANANRRGHNDGYGSGYSYQPRYSPVQYGFKSSNQPKNFVSVTKSETGSRNIITGKKTPSVYYTQSSTCGYFTNTCVYSNGRKICLPKPKANPDGTPIVCRN
ncbi:uncharacterized protein [Atheta coriaria]|uniref:uncharacterized protein isoform X2 n=1 Tax=Dalotia coriaria TaxID=877792 RepID=UPI0031F384B5